MNAIIAGRDNYPDNMTAWDFERAGITGPEPAEVPAGTWKRVKAMIEAARHLRDCIDSVISADGDDMTIGGLCPSELSPDPAIFCADWERDLQAWADEEAKRAAECDEERAADLWREDR